MMRPPSPRGPRRRDRRGITLLEVVVFSAIGLVIVYAAWSLFRSAMSKGTSTDTKLQGVQTSLLFALTLESDLESIFLDRPWTFAVDPDTGDADLAFHCYPRKSVEETWEPLEFVEVTYQFRRGTRRVIRRYGDESPRELLGHFERVSFRVVEPSPVEEGEPLPEAGSVIYSAVTAPPEVFDRPEEARKPSDLTMILGGVPVVRNSRLAAYPFWNPVPYGP